MKLGKSMTAVSKESHPDHSLKDYRKEEERCSSIVLIVYTANGPFQKDNSSIHHIQRIITNWPCLDNHSIFNRMITKLGTVHKSVLVFPRTVEKVF